MPPALPLTGLRVLTFENFGAGPFGSMYLADLGAEVIKIENRDQGGDATRSMGPFFLGEHDSQFFQAFNLNKKSVTLNLKHAAGREAFHRLVRTADVVLNNLRGDQPEKLGLDYATLGPINPRVLCAHLSAYGRDNERKGWPGYDYLMQAEAGYLHLSGEPGSPAGAHGTLDRRLHDRHHDGGRDPVVAVRRAERRPRSRHRRLAVRRRAAPAHLSGRVVPELRLPHRAPAAQRAPLRPCRCSCSARATAGSSSCA